jgi:hypothetical protein
VLDLILLLVEGLTGAEIQTKLDSDSFIDRRSKWFVAKQLAGLFAPEVGPSPERVLPRGSEKPIWCSNSVRSKLLSSGPRVSTDRQRYYFRCVTVRLERLDRDRLQWLSRPCRVHPSC